VNEKLQTIASKFFFDPGNGAFYYLTRHGRFLELKHVNSWCLLNYRKTLFEAGGQDLLLYKALDDEIEARRARGEIPPMEVRESGK